MTSSATKCDQTKITLVLVCLLDGVRRATSGGADGLDEQRLTDAQLQALKGRSDAVVDKIPVEVAAATAAMREMNELIG